MSSLAPRKLSFSEGSKQGGPGSAGIPRTGTKGKINLMLVASKPLREDIVEFLEDDKTGAPLGKSSFKFEVPPHQLSRHPLFPL